MATKAAAIKPRASKSNTPTRSGKGKAVQRKVLPNLMVLPGAIQRKEQPGSWVHQQPQRAVNNRPLVQPKINIHSSSDRYEKEADHVADKVVSNERISATSISRVKKATQRKCAACEKEDKAVQAMHIQRKCSSCEEKETVQKKTNDTSMHAAGSLRSSDSSPPAQSDHSISHPLDKVIGSQSARGSPLPEATRTHMENSMGADFSNVRIHAGQASHEASTAIGARAFTHGGDIHFANGEFNPSTKAGKHLLAHELAHTIQQGAARPDRKKEEKAPVKGLRKLVPKPAHEKKIARLTGPHDNKESSQKNSHADFAKKFKNKKAPKLAGALMKKAKGKKLNKDPVALPKKAKKQKEAPPKAVAKPQHLQQSKSHLSKLSKLSASSINFKPLEDKKAAEHPVQKAQAQQSKNYSEGILQKAGASAQHIFNTISKVRPRLAQFAAKSISRIKQNEAAQKLKIDNDIKAQKAAVKKAMQSAAGSINAHHKKVIAELTAAAKKARADILTAKTTNTNSINLAALMQTPVILKAYVDAQKNFEKSGSDVGNECSRRQNDRSWNEFISKMKHEDDSFLDGPYTDDMKQARGDAAVKIGEGYRDGLTKAGVDQGKEIYKGVPNDLKKVEDARKEMLTHVDESYDRSLKAIDAAETSGKTQADGTKKSMLNSVGAQHKAAQAKLDLTKKTQTQLTEILSLKQSQQVELQTAQATESMEEGGAQSLMHLNNGFNEYKQVCESMNSPPPALLQQKLAPIEAKLAETAPSMAATLQKGLLQTEAGLSKTTNETVTTTNSTVAESLTQAKADNAKAIDGLKKLQSSAISALEGILKTNKSTITTTASSCVSEIEGIKAAFDSTLTNIAKDLTDGLKKGSDELKTGLTNTIDFGQGETKSLLNASIEAEDKAAGEVSPRWKSALKILLVIVVTLVIALVVGPAVIGFIGAAAGGGAFGAAVGAVVGGAILGAASSAVITIGNNLIDGKTWYTGVGHAMLEGAITGAIGGAFGAAGGALAGKMIDVAAKGIGPALGRFAIQQAVDFAGNVTTEYVSSKLQGKPFEWGNVIQGQAIGVGMHIGMGGLGALKDVKGFRTINKITEGAGHLGESFGNKVRGKVPVTEPHISAPKPSVEEPMNKGPAAPKEEPVATAPKEETKGPAPKEEPVSSKPKEEPMPTAPKEEPVSSKPKEDPKGTAPKEEPVGSKPKEEPKGPGTKEDPASSKKAPDEKKPSNLTQEEVNDGIAAKHPTEDGHHMKVTEDGMLVKCSVCELMDMKYAKDFENPKNKAMKEEFEKIKGMSDPEAKAKAAAEFDEKMMQSLVDEYKANNPNTGKSDAKIREQLNAGERMNPETGLFNKPSEKPEVKKKADFERTGTEKDAPIKVDEYDPKDFHEPVKAKNEEAIAARKKGQSDRDAHAEGTPDYKKHQVEVIQASEKLGNNAAEGVAQKKGFTGEPLNTGPEFRDGAGTFDRVFEKDGKYMVAESKGGSSELGSREAIVDGEPTRVQQGTPEYFDSICDEMMKPGRSDQERALGAKLKDAYKNGDVEYVMVQQPVDKGNTLGNVKVKTFKK